MKKIVLGILVCMCAFVMFGCSCSKEEETIEYGDKEAVAEGTVTLSGDEAKISISNIKAKLGADIDYLSNVIVEDEEKYDDLEVWVDASAVDIYEPGDYTAKYTFKYDGKSIEHEIKVTILDEEIEKSASTNEANNEYADNNVEETTTKQQGGNSNNGNVAGNDAQNNSQSTANSGNTVGGSDATVNNGNTATTTKNNSNNNQTTTKNNSQATTTKNNNQATTTKNNSTAATTTKNSNTATTTKNNSTTATTTKNNATTTTSKREIITTSGSTTEVQNIGFAYIELLSGSTVSIKTTTAKYIVSTRTDVSYTTKNGVKYKVSKLVIRYNTGDERVLETVEEKCN